MKKMIFSLLLAAATMNVMAITFTQKVKIYISDGHDTYYNVLGVSPDGTVATTYNFDNRDFALYVKVGANKYQNYTQASLEEVELGLMTNSKTSYTISAAEVTGEPLRIKLLDGSIFVASEGASKTFTAQASQAEITGMMINPIEPTLCHQYGKLLITGHKGESLVVTDMDDNEKINIASLPTNNEAVELDALEAGKQYKVILNSADAVIIRK